jgi:hypothetical protein
MPAAGCRNGENWQEFVKRSLGISTNTLLNNCQQQPTQMLVILKSRSNCNRCFVLCREGAEKCVRNLGNNTRQVEERISRSVAYSCKCTGFRWPTRTPDGTNYSGAVSAESALYFHCPIWILFRGPTTEQSLLPTTFICRFYVRV